VRFLLWLFVAIGVAASLYLSYQIGTQAILVGSREGRWFYFYLASFRPTILLACAAASATGLAALYLSDRVGHASEWLVVLVWFVAAVVIEAAICSLAPFPFDKIFASDGANSFNTVASHFTPGTMLGDFESVRKLWPPHGQSNMPGKSIFVYGLRRISRSGIVLPWLVVIVSNLGGLLMYGLVRDLLQSRRAALYALILYIVVPGKMFFFPLLNTVTPVPALLATWLLVRWLRTGGLAYAALLGLSVYVLALWEPLGLALGLLFVTLIIASYRTSIEPRALVWGLLAGAVMFGVAYGVMVVRFRFDLLSTVRLLAADAVRFNEATRRPHEIWVYQNLFDFLVAVGACQAVLVVGALVDGFARGKGSLTRLAEPVVAFSLGLAGVVLVLDWLGVNRGEVVRLWIFLACLCQIPAAYVCARLESPIAIALIFTVTLLYDALGTAMVGFILPG